MHEMALVRKVVDLVLETCEGQDVERVRSVHLYIGDLYDVVDDFVPGLFQHLARGTVAEGAQIAITHVPATVICNHCGFVFPLDTRDETTWECPQCAAKRDYHLYTGREFLIDSIEVEGRTQIAAAGDGRATGDTASQHGAETAIAHKAATEQRAAAVSTAQAESYDEKEAVCA